MVRSDDGDTWRTVLGPGLDGCTDTPADTDFVGADKPLVVGDEALVAFACPGRDPGLYRISAEQPGTQAVEHLPPDGRFGAPMDVRGDVVVPVHDAIGNGVHRFAVLDDEDG